MLKRSWILIIVVLLMTGCSVKMPDIGNLFGKKTPVAVPTEAAVVAPIVVKDLFEGQLAQFVDPYPSVVIESGQNMSFEFNDESSYDPSLVEFIKKIKIATKEQNKEKLLSLMSEDLVYIPNVSGSKTGFTRYWDLDQTTPNKEIWLDLQKIIVWGGMKEGNDSYVIPSLYKQFPDKEMVIQSRVNMRSEPDVNSAKVNQYSFTFIEVTNAKTGKTYDLEGITYPWVGVKAEDGSEGYMVSAFIYGKNDYHLVLKKIENQWFIVEFSKNSVK